MLFLSDAKRYTSVTLLLVLVIEKVILPAEIVSVDVLQALDELSSSITFAPLSIRLAQLESTSTEESAMTIEMENLCEVFNMATFNLLS